MARRPARTDLIKQFLDATRRPASAPTTLDRYLRLPDCETTCQIEVGTKNCWISYELLAERLPRMTSSNSACCATGLRLLTPRRGSTLTGD